jgi:hypothetical protein
MNLENAAPNMVVVGEATVITPTVGIGSCAIVANGDVTLAPKSAMNSRRLIVSSEPRRYRAL